MRSIPAVVAAKAPLISPDLSQAKVDAATVALAKATAPFIPAKVRVAIYIGAGSVGIAAGAVAAVVGGQLGDALDLLGSAALALTGVTAIAHVNQ